ncbi:hypothetical protein NWF32_24635 [Pseudomonas qingdaonensis]|nr:hypothetical protein [Pseudomonas qingdaonensis]
MTRQPELMAYYSTMLEDERKSKQAFKDALEELPDLPEAVTESPAPIVSSAAPLSLFDLYSELFQLAEQAKSDSGNLRYAEQIEALITSNLPRLKEEYSLSDDAVRKY